MSYKTYTDQILEHLHFLQSNGLDIKELAINVGFVRCCELGQTGRGELSYKTIMTKLNNGTIGLATWCRGKGGIQGNYQTYGLSPNENEACIKADRIASTLENKSITEVHESIARKSYGFWMHSSEVGKSEYLERKGVGSYGIRFRSSEQYGNVVVVPMFDEKGKLWSYQLLNPDGSKRMPKGARTNGLFHVLANIINGSPIGIAESYVTAATCMELTNYPVVCAFSCHNLKEVTLSIRKLYPLSPLIIFADNDRHLGNGNQGLLKAQEAVDVIDSMIIMDAPSFDGLEPSKEASDWNDLVRLRGREIAKAQILEMLIYDL